MRPPLRPATGTDVGSRWRTSSATPWRAGDPQAASISCRGLRRRRDRALPTMRARPPYAPAAHRRRSARSAALGDVGLQLLLLGFEFFHPRLDHVADADDAREPSVHH